MSIGAYLSNFFSGADSSWSFVSIPFAVAFILFFGLYILIRKHSRLLMLGYVVAFSMFFAWKANGVLMLLLPLTFRLTSIASTAACRASAAASSTSTAI